MTAPENEPSPQSPRSPRRLRLIALGHGFEPGHLLFRGITAELRPGAVWGLRGPSGSGKSTLLSLLAGWDSPVEGRIEREGIDAVRWVFQNPLGVARRTALDHVTLPYLATGHGRRRAEVEAMRLLTDFGLRDSARKNFALLSGGEAQRLMLARALAGRPHLILVDEPTAQLDRATAATVNGALGRLARSGAVVVVASHDHETLDACTEVIDLAGSGTTP